jgi:zeaxanthin glucosyltransferase
VTLYADELIKGMIDPDAVTGEGAFGALRQIRGHLRRISLRGRWEVLQGVADNEFASILRERAVDHVLVDGLFSFMVPLVAASGIPYQVYLTELSGARGEYAVPSYSGAIPGRGGVFGALKIKLSWAHALPQIVRLFWLNALYIGIPRPPKTLLKMVKLRVRDSARRAGLKRSLWEYGWRWADGEVVLCPAAFDFPETRRGRTYAGPWIDLERKDWPFPWEEFEQRRAERKVVLVSLGTRSSEYGSTPARFLRKVFEIATRCPQLFFVVALGKGRTVESVGVPPDNVMAFPFLPQLDLLERASAMITNGGLGTVKECIWFKVPMVVAPCRFDQPSNAARVVRHNLGRRVNVGRVSVAQLQNAIEACLDDPQIAENIAAMSTAFRESSEQEHWIEQIVSHELR